jgi:hypothetical protein
MLISAREADSMLPRTQLPEVGMPFDVTVTHVEHPESFFIQRSPDFDMEDVYDTDPTLLDVEEELERLEEMALNINKEEYFKKYEPLTHAKTGESLAWKVVSSDSTKQRLEIRQCQSFRNGCKRGRTVT